MPSPVIPPVDPRIIRIFVGVTKVSDFMKQARRCEVRGFHQPHVDAGQNAAKPWQVFTVTEQCVGRDGRRCRNHGLEFSLQLSDEQRVRAVYQLVQLDPFPYDSEPLLDYCLRYLSLLHHLIPPLRDVVPDPAGTADVVEAERSLQPRGRVLTPDVGQDDTSHRIRYAGWVSRLIPPIPSVAAAAGSSIRGSAAIEPSTSCNSFTVTVKRSNVYCYTKNARHPVNLQVEAKKRDHMVYVSLRQPAILSTFGLKSRVRRLAQKLQIYDTLGGKWFHSPTETLWLRLNVNEALILKTSDVHVTPGLENYVLKSLTKPQHPGSDILPGFLASTRASINSIPPFAPVPPLTVMVATIPEEGVATSSSHSASFSLPSAEGSGLRTTDTSDSAAIEGGSIRVTKRQKRNDGSATLTTAEVIDISSDEESNLESNTVPASRRPRKRLVVHPPAPRLVLPGAKKPAKPQVTYWKLIPRATKPTKNPEVIVVSDDESPPTAHNVRAVTPSSSRQSPTSALIPSSSRQPASATGDYIVISDDESPVEASGHGFNMLSRRQAFARAVGSGAGEVVPSAMAGPSTGQPNTTGQREGRSDKGKGKMRAQVDDDDDDVDSDATLC